jgi:hypothetical protein
MIGDASNSDNKSESVIPEEGIQPDKGESS